MAACAVGDRDGLDAAQVRSARTESRTATWKVGHEIKFLGLGVRSGDDVGRLRGGSCQ